MPVDGTLGAQAGAVLVVKDEGGRQQADAQRAAELLFAIVDHRQFDGVRRQERVEPCPLISVTRCSMP